MTYRYSVLPLLSSSDSSAILLRMNPTVGGWIISLNSMVPYTSNPKPTTCSHLKVSHPSPRLTTQMNSVLHVSIVLRAVAETVRVTDSPKKLKPLEQC